MATKSFDLEDFMLYTFRCIKFAQDNMLDYDYTKVKTDLNEIKNFIKYVHEMHNLKLCVLYYDKLKVCPFIHPPGHDPEKKICAHDVYLDVTGIDWSDYKNFSIDSTQHIGSVEYVVDDDENEDDEDDEDEEEHLAKRMLEGYECKVRLNLVNDYICLLHYCYYGANQ